MVATLNRFAKWFVKLFNVGGGAQEDADFKEASVARSSQD